MKSSIQKKQREKNKHQVTCEMICKSHSKELSRIEKFLNDVRSKLHFDDGTMYRLMICCTEAVNNAIIHGNKSDPEKRVVIRCISNKRSLTIKVKDEGTGFDPDILQDPREEKNLLKENGRGVFLIRSLMDKVSFKRLKSGAVVEMKVNIP
jgi:serine/threonine-protein kinase RsbW